MKHKHSLLTYVAFSAFFVMALAVSTFLSRADKLLTFTPEASNQYALQTYTLTNTSLYNETDTATFFDLASRTKSDGLYELPEISAEAVTHFLAQKPVFTLSGDSTARLLIPDDMQNIRLRKAATDDQLNNDLNANVPNAIGLQNADADTTHFYFDQVRCGEVPVFGSYVHMHVSSASQVYAASGALVEGETLCKRTLTPAQIGQKAIAAYAEEFDGANPVVRSSEEYIYGPQLFGDPSPREYLSSFVTVCAEDYCHGYFVDQGDGRIHQDYPVTLDAKNRRIVMGSTVRTEGQGPSNNQEINKAYDNMGRIWDYYNSNFNRDSYDNRGSALRVEIRQSSQIQAWWDGQSITAYTSVNLLDVLTHEFQHGVTQYTAGLAQSPEPGALNEGISDIFGSILDSGDWLMGEEGRQAIRNMQNPNQFRHPDSTVDSLYYCGSQDSGGVHINNGVIDKAFYLMSDGGTHNGCTMTGLGRDTAGKIVYKALATYLQGKRTAGFKETYSAINLACNDLHGAGSPECLNVKAAMESTSMDRTNRCRGGVVDSKPTCAGGSQPPVPTATPGQQPTTGPLPTTGPQPTAGPTSTIPTTTVPTPSTSVPAPTTTVPTTSRPSSTPQPTPVPISIKQAPLLSVLSSPYALSGDVKIEKTGSETVVTATLEADIIRTLVGSSAIFDDVDELRGRLIGEDVVETGTFATAGTTITNVFRTTNDLSDYVSYQVYQVASAGLPEQPVLLADITQKSQTDLPENLTILDLTLRFQGITRKPPATQAQLVRVGLSGGNIDGVLYKKAVFTPDDRGIWHGRVTYHNLTDITNGAIRIKGPRHSQKKYCVQRPTEQSPGESLCEEEVITLNRGVNTLDFTGVYQLAGDVNQDGVVNSVDINNIRSVMNSRDRDDLQFGDLNNDGVINSVDDSLAIYTLSNRTQQY